MPENTATTALRALFRFPVEGENWRNSFIIGSLLLIAGFWIPFIPWIFVYGYVVLLMRQGIEGREPTLPAWKDWGRLGQDGLKVLAVMLVYLLPGIVVLFGGMFLYFGFTMLLPLWLGGFGPDMSSEAGVGLFISLMLGSMGVLFMAIFVGSLLGFAGSLPLPVATAHFVAQDDLGAAFRVRQWWPLLKANKLGYLIAWVITFGLGGLIYLIYTLTAYTIILLCFIPFIIAPVMFYITVVTAALFGQTYRESRALLGEEIEINEADLSVVEK